MGPLSSEVSSQESVNGDTKKSSHPSQAPSSSRDALQHSAEASRFLQKQDYKRALHHYQQALQLYQAQHTIVGQCNAAATLHNMALLHKQCGRYEHAVSCFQQAEDLYRDCAATVETVVVSSVQQQEEGHVCLDALLVETLHNRAHVHSKHLHNVDLAIACHEQVVETILGMEEQDDQETPREPSPQDVLYVKMTNAQRVALLAESLKMLGIFYNSKGETEGALGALEEALEVLKCQVDECPDDVASKKSMATVLINLASVFFGQDDFSQALGALQNAMDIWMNVGEDPSRTDVLATVNNMGLAHERMGNLEKALECYEDVLHVKSQLLGSDHVEVADSLTTVAKVLERQGNAEGALDLYQEALRIYQMAANDEDPSLWANAAHVLGRIGTILLEMDQVDESIDRFQEALQMEHHTLGVTSEDTASIYHGLGRAYMAKHQLEEAREYLLKAAHMLEAVPDDSFQLDSLVESSEMLKQALNNESFLSSDGTWVNAEINIEKTPERLALASSMSPIGESSLSANPGSTEDESPSDHFSSSSMSSHVPSSVQLTQLQVFVHPAAPAVDSSIEVEVSPLMSCKRRPTSPVGKKTDVAQEFDTHLSPSCTSRDSKSGANVPESLAIDARQASVLDTVDINSPLRTTASGQGHEIALLKSGPSDEERSNQPDLYLSSPGENSKPSLSATKEPAAQVDVSAVASPMVTMFRDKYGAIESDNETGDETEEEELHRELMMEFSTYESQSDLGTNTADYANSSLAEADDYTNDSRTVTTDDDGGTDDCTNTDDDSETDDYTNTDYDDGETADYTNTDDDGETEAYTNASDLDTASRKLSSVAEVDISRSYNFAADESESRVFGESTVEETARTEDAYFAQPERDTTVFEASMEESVHTEDAHLSGRTSKRTAMEERQPSPTFVEETNSWAESNESTSVRGDEASYSASDKSVYSAPERAAEGEDHYRHLSTDADESEIFDTDLDTEHGPISGEEESDHNTDSDREDENLERYDGTADEPPRIGYSRRLVQLDVRPMEEISPRNALDESPGREAFRRTRQSDVSSRVGRVRRRDCHGVVQSGDEAGRNEAQNDLDATDVDVDARPAVETDHHWPSAEIEREESDDNDPVEQPLLACSGLPNRNLESPRENRMSSPRVMLVKAFRHSFGRKRSSGSKTRLDAMPEDMEHHDSSLMVMSDHALPKAHEQRATPSFDRTGSSPTLGPIQYVDLHAPSFDEVSQITFLADETSARRRTNSAGSWWWGASSEGGLEGWFPAVVGAAEEFLSARTIHDQIKSSKRETSSSSTDEESDIFGDLSVGKVETPSQEMNGDDENVECDIEVDANGHVGITGHGASPIFSQDKTFDPVLKPPPTTNSGAVPSLDTDTHRKGSSTARSRPKVQELEKTLESQRSQLGRKHPDVAETLTTLAVMKSQDGEIVEAVEMLHEALHIRKSIGNRAEFARTLHKLGDVYARQKEYKSSLSCHMDALNLERLVYGYRHPEVAKSLNKIGSVHAGKGEFSVAISNHQHALQILKDCVGEDLSHPLVAQTLICIGAVYYKERNSLETIRANSDGYSTFIDSGMLDVIARAHEQRGSYRMAIAFFEEKLQLLRSRDKNGMDKQDVAEALVRLGTLSREAGLYLEALDYFDETENIQTALGRNQVEIAKGRLLKGTVLYHLGQYKMSLKLLKEAISILQATVGDDQQVLIAETFQWIGIVQTDFCDYNSATKALNVALRIQSGVLGNDNPATLKTRLALATILLHRAELDAAIERLTAILETQGRVHGPKHPNLAETMYYIGRAYMMKGDIVSAMKFFEESFFMAEKFLGHDHPSQASTLHCIADLQRMKRRYKKSLHLLTSVLTMRKDTLGEGHLSVAMTMCSIGACHAATGRFSESTKVLQEALLIAERAVGTNASIGRTHSCDERKLVSSKVSIRTS